MDGLVIGASFLVGIQFGIITTLVIILHEIPQEIGDFGILVYGGFTKFKALYFNFFIALTCIAGAVAGYFISAYSRNFFTFLIPFTAGGFIYICACDLIPEIHKQPELKKSALSMLAFLLGILLILIVRIIPSH
jgi:zinc and cadmium transporter